MINVSSPFVVEFTIAYLIRRFHILTPYVPKTENEDTLGGRMMSIGMKKNKDNKLEDFDEFAKRVEKYSFMYFAILTI